MLDKVPQCCSELGELEIVMLCKPSELSIPDMKTAYQVGWKAPVDKRKALASHLNMRQVLEEQGIQVIDYSEYLSATELKLNDQLINRCYVRDLAGVVRKQVITGRPAISMRLPEYDQAHQVMQSWFNPDRFFTPNGTKGATLEFGDVSILNRDAIVINVGKRTSIGAIESIKQAIFDAGFSEIAVIDLPRHDDTMHLDFNFNVMAANLVVAKSFLRFFPLRVICREHTRYAMFEDYMRYHGYEVHALSSYDTIPDINFLNINPETILISQQANTARVLDHPKLKQKKVIKVDVTELEKGGGGIRCMTLPLRRREIS
ncbi:arginine deiminase family protein [Polycladospora coralii]|nr:arginine deiminase family protein [Polycladospora coralii]